MRLNTFISKFGKTPLDSPYLRQSAEVTAHRPARGVKPHTYLTDKILTRETPARQRISLSNDFETL